MNCRCSRIWPLNTAVLAVVPTTLAVFVMASAGTNAHRERGGRHLRACDDGIRSDIRGSNENFPLRHRCWTRDHNGMQAFGVYL